MPFCFNYYLFVYCLVLNDIHVVNVSLAIKMNDLVYLFVCFLFFHRKHVHVLILRFGNTA